ncbi:MAG: JDVT-CTERM system CAAX-type protease, partial [Burkholderiales bacterium]|nr:JDVT-CTERM system CAAX-type protease [Burkholderiales bacterium]
AATAAGLGASRLWMLLVFAPLFEECVFRAGVQEALLRRSVAPGVANLVTAALFGAVHVAMRGEASAWAVVLPALVVGAAYGRWRRLRICVVLHAAMNAAALAWPWLGALAHLGP